MDNKQAVTALGALAHDTRLDVFRMLVRRGPEGLPAGTIAERLALPPSSLTFHLQQLVHAGLITQRRVSRQIICAASYGTMDSLMAYLMENCCSQATCALVFAQPAPASARKKQRRLAS